MSLSPNEKYPGKIEVDPNYKDGKFKDSSPSTANNGSPLKAIDRNEQLALQEAVMNAAGFEYNGTVDTPENSQMFAAYKAALSNGANLLSNHNFIIASPDDSQPAPSATPTSYPPGFQIFSGVFANETTGILNLTYIDGRVSFSGGDFYIPRANSKELENITEFVASVADFDGKPRTRGVSFALVGDEYRVTVGVDALEDESANETLLGSVKFEQGSVATGHFVGSLSSFNLSDYTNYIFNSVSDMQANSLNITFSVGDKLSTGATHWKVVNTNGLALPGGLKAIPANGLHLSDFGLSVDNTASENVTAFNEALSVAESLQVATIKISHGDYAFDDGFSLTTEGVTVKGDYARTKLNFSHSGDIACFDVKANRIKFRDFFADVNHTSAPSNGGVGNIIQIGAYSTQTPELYNDIEMSNLELTKSGTYAATTTVIGIYNRCNTIKGRDIIIDGGSSGVICHWSGDFDINNPDTSPATITWHPFAIDFKNLTVRNGVLAVSISGCYDVTFKKVVSDSCNNGLYILPGDFGNTIADATQSKRIGDNVVCSGFTITNPSGLAVQVVGNGGRDVFTMLTTARSTLRNFSIVSGNETASIPVLIDKAYNVTVDNIKIAGYEAYDGISLLYARNFRMLNSEINAQRGVVIAASIGVDISQTDVIGDGTDSSIGVKVSETQTTSVTLTSNITDGDTSINVSATTLTLYGGQEIIFPDGRAVEIAANDYFPIGSTNLIIEPSTTSQTSGTAGNVYGNSRRVTIRGGKNTKHLYGVEIEGRSESVTVQDVNFVKNRRNDVYIHGTLNKEVKLLDNDYSQSNTNSGGNRANIQADFVDGLTITGGSFNEVGADVDPRFGVNLGADVSNANINSNDVYGLETGGVFVFHNAQSPAAAARGRNFIGINRLQTGLTEVSGGGYDTVTIVAVP